MHICTIVARNYLPQARVLATSFRAHHPDGRVTVLVIDDRDKSLSDEHEPFDVIRVEELCGDVTDLHRMAGLYSVVEYSTALKPWLLRTLMQTTSAPITYLDPDIQIFGSLSEVLQLAQAHDVVLTPHVTAPMSRDNKMISESMILGAGIYNLGFIAISPSSDGLLEFWMERLRRECVVQPEEMRFVDQRWMDFAPGFCDAAILRDPGYNVAYWNLDKRNVKWVSNQYEVTGNPLRFFHFSGYDPKSPHLLSKHQVQPPRVLLSERPAIKQLCDQYGDLLKAAGHGADAGVGGYAFTQMANGIVMDGATRRLFREAVARADRGESEYPSDPFDGEGADAFLSWVKDIAEVHWGPARLSRYLAALYAQRLDLQAVFRDPQREDYRRFVSWAYHEAAAGRIDPRLLPPREPDDGDVPTAADTWAPSDQLRPGFTVVGYLKAELGVGEWGRLTAEAFRAAGLPTAMVVSSATTSRQEHPYEVCVPEEYDFDTNVLCVNADQVPHVRAHLGEGCFAGRYVVSQWAWELEEFPDQWQGSFDLVDEVWAISEFARAGIAAKTTKPVFVVPPAIVAPEVERSVDRRTLGLPRDRYLFLFTFDLLSVLERKNPLGLVEAFRRAFPSEQVGGPVLVLKVINGDQRVADLERIRLAVFDRTDVVILDEYLSASKHAALMASADCYVSLHRSEGFGLTMAESMALGKPVIATGYSGNLEFMSPETAYLVRWSEGAVPAGCEPYRPGARWAEPDLDDAARLLRFVFEHPNQAAETGERARRTVLTSHGIESRAVEVRRRFEAIQARRAGRVAVSPVPGGKVNDSTPTDTNDLVGSATSRPSLDTVARHLPRVTRLYRRVVLRAQRHHDEHQRGINRLLAQGILSLDARLIDRGAELEERLRALEVLVGEFQQNVQATVSGHEATMRGLELGVQGLADGAIADLWKASAGLQAQVTDVSKEVRTYSAKAQKEFADVRNELAELRVVPYMADPEELMTVDDDGRPVIGYRHDDRRDAVTGQDYAAFEDVFRGREETIRDRQRAYLPLLTGQAPVLDVGCGRGEMLGILNSAHIDAAGVDVDESMIERCRARGYAVHHIDALTYLSDQPDDSIGGIFCAQVIEHLPYDELVSFLAESYRVLRSGGVLLMETVNPHAVHAFKTFWTDITHKAPIFPEVAVALCRSAHFEEATVMFPSGTGVLENDRWSEGEYAVIARKMGHGL